MISFQVNYDMPKSLGALVFEVPAGWVGARHEGAEAAWVEEEAMGPVTANAVLKIREREAVIDPEALLSEYVRVTLDVIGGSVTEDVREGPNRRFFACETTSEGQPLRQDCAVFYQERQGLGYLITLTGTSAPGTIGADTASAVIL